MSQCEFSTNVSTASSRRRRWWEANKGAVPPDMVVGVSCGEQCCHTPEHALLRPKINIATARPLFEHFFKKFDRLGIGNSLDLTAPGGQDVDRWARKLRSQLQGNRRFYLFRWSVRVQPGRKVSVQKIGKRPTILTASTLKPR